MKRARRDCHEIGVAVSRVMVVAVLVLVRVQVCERVVDVRETRIENDGKAVERERRCRLGRKVEGRTGQAAISASRSNRLSHVAYCGVCACAVCAAAGKRGSPCLL